MLIPPQFQAVCLHLRRGAPRPDSAISPCLVQVQLTTQATLLCPLGQFHLEKSHGPPGLIMMVVLSE